MTMDIPPTLTSASGTYILLLRLKQRRVRTIGRLGEISFAPGWYAYVGSAFGPGGLAARIRRHLRSAKKYHWHIDYLCDDRCVTGVWTGAGPDRQEHRWAAALMSAPFNGRGIAGFGCSDCRCHSHLIFLEAAPDQVDMQERLGA